MISSKLSKSSWCLFVYVPSILQVPGGRGGVGFGKCGASTSRRRP